MTKDEFLQYSKSEVRYSNALLHGYIELFKKTFKREPNCAGCTFDSDYNRLRKALLQNQETKKTMAEIKQTFEVNPANYNEIIRVNGKSMYIQNATDEDVFAYLNEKGGDLELRKSKFKTLPSVEKNENIEDFTKAELIELAKAENIEGYSTMNKAELIKALS